MATAVLDFDYLNLPEEISGLEGYARALVLVRIGRLPGCQVNVAVEDGRISRTALIDEVANQALRSFWDAWLFETLEPGWAQTPSFIPRPASVAICTRDRPDDLYMALTSLQSLPDDGQEILVVDSASADNRTREVAEQFAGVRYLREEVPGLNRARNRALREARHEIVAFIDDDARADPFWLRGLTRNFQNPLTLCVTGLTMPVELQTEAQELFERYSPFSRGFTRCEYDRWRLSPLAANRAGAGANMAWRKTTLDKIGPFDPALDAGTATQSGGDTEMFARALTHGYRVVYEPAALNWHRHRRTWPELLRVVYGYGVGTYALLTRRWLTERDPGVVWVALDWLISSQLPGLARAILRRPGSLPGKIILSELRGCLKGPGAYLAARRKVGEQMT